MMYNLDFVPSVLKVIAKYKKSNPSLYKKLNSILQDIQEHLRTGKGHPEPLVGGNNITYSRRITAQDRVIYNIFDNTVTVVVVEVEGHYKDK